MLALTGILLLPAAARCAPLGEALNAPELAWTTSGDAPWVAQSSNTHDGAAAAQAGAVGFGQQSKLSAPVTGPGTVVFWASVETPTGATELTAGYDGHFMLSLYEQSPVVGRGWKAYAFEVPAGSHELAFTWRTYATDPAAVGTHHAWVDQVSFADYSGQAPALVVEPADTEVDEDYPWPLSVALTGALPVTARLQCAGYTFTYPQWGRPQWTPTIDRVTADMAGSWQIVLANAFGSVTSRPFNVIVRPSPPRIQGGPYSTEVGLGAPLELSAQTRGTAPIHLQWQRDGLDLPGQNGPVLSLAATVAADAGAYRLMATNPHGAATSQVATVTLSTNPPRIENQSQSLAVVPGDGAEFWVDCTGSNPLHYQWQKNGADLAGATEPSLWIGNAQPADSGSYRVVVTNLFGTVTSETVTLTVTDPIAEALDAPALRFDPYDDLTPWTVVTDTTHDGSDAARSAPIEHDGFSGLKTTLTGPGTLKFWWKVSSEPDADVFQFLVDDAFQGQISGEVDWQPMTFAVGPGEHTILWLYAKTPSGTGGEDAAWLDQVEWSPAAAISFGEALEVPDLEFQTSEPAPWKTQLVTSHDGVDAAQSGSPEFGEDSNLTVTLKGPGRLSFWARTAGEPADRLYFFINDSTQPGELEGHADWQQRSFPIPTGTHTFAWSYRNRGSFVTGSIRAWLDEVVWQAYELDDALDVPGQEVNVDGDWPWFRQTSVTHDGVDAAQSPVPPPQTDNWFTLQFEGPGTLTFRARISAAPGDALRFFSGFTSRSILYGDSDWTAFTYEIKPGAQSVGWSFWKSTDQAAGLNAAFVDELEFTPRRAPTIATPPQPAKLLRGRSFNLSASAVGEAPLAYLWLKDGTNIPQATASSYSRTDCGFADTGNYAVIVTNSLGAVTSAVARVAVVPRFYRIQNLGTLGSLPGATSEAYDVNNLGEVVGRADTDEAKSYGNRLHHAFVWWGPGASLLDLGDGRTATNVDGTNRLAGHSLAYAINDNSDIVGHFEHRTHPTQDGYAHAALWRQIHCLLPPPVRRCPLELVDLHPRGIFPPDTVAVDVNPRHQVLVQGGQAFVLNHFGYLLSLQDPLDRFSPYTTVSLGDGGLTAIDPYALNHAGLVVGRYREQIGADLPWRYDGAQHIGSDALPNPPPVPGSRQLFKAVNDHGVIAGLWHTNDAQGYLVRHPFLQHADGRFEPLPSFIHPYDLEDINNRNQVVGNGGLSALLYSDGHVFELNDLLREGDNADIRTANALNDRGQIVGQAQFPGVGAQAYLLTPTTPNNGDPVARDDTLTLSGRSTTLIPAGTLLANDTDPEGDRLQLDSVAGSGPGTATQAGGKVRREGDTVRYAPPELPSPGGGIVTDSFSYAVSDGMGGTAEGRVTIQLSDAAPEPQPLFETPIVSGAGLVTLAGNAPAGSTVWIYSSPDPAARTWQLELTLTVPASGTWSVVLNVGEGRIRTFYRAEVQPPTP